MAQEMTHLLGVKEAAGRRLLLLQGVQIWSFMFIKSNSQGPVCFCIVRLKQ